MIHLLRFLVNQIPLLLLSTRRVIDCVAVVSYISTRHMQHNYRIRARSTQTALVSRGNVASYSFPVFLSTEHIDNAHHSSPVIHTVRERARVLFSYHLEPIRSSGHIAQLPRPIGNGMRRRCLL